MMDTATWILIVLLLVLAIQPIRCAVRQLLRTKRNKRRGGQRAVGKEVNFPTKEKVKRTERGWPGHYICAERCLFRRNTLLEYADYKIVVSTVGRQRPFDPKAKEFERIGASRHYETFVSKADDSEYHDMNLSKTVFLYPSQGVTWHLNIEDELLANQMHEDAVEWVSRQMLHKAIVFEEHDILVDWNETSYENFIKNKKK